MAIDKESTGVPEFDAHRPTTKVNLGIVAAVGIFFAVVFGAVVYFASHAKHPESNRPNPPTENATSRDAPAPATDPGKK